MSRPDLARGDQTRRRLQPMQPRRRAKNENSLANPPRPKCRERKKNATAVDLGRASTLVEIDKTKGRQKLCLENGDGSVTFRLSTIGGLRVCSDRGYWPGPRCVRPLPSGVGLEKPQAAKVDQTKGNSHGSPTIAYAGEVPARHNQLSRRRPVLIPVPPFAASGASICCGQIRLLC